MAHTQEILDMLTRIDAATTAIGARLQTMADQLANGVTADEAAAIAARLSVEADALEAMGKDPNAPVG